MKKIFILISAVFLLLIGCNKNNPVDTNNQGNNPTWNLIYEGNEVYHYPYSVSEIGYVKASEYSKFMATFDYQSSVDFQFLLKDKATQLLISNPVMASETNKWCENFAVYSYGTEKYNDDTLYFYARSLPLSNIYLRNIKFYGYK